MNRNGFTLIEVLAAMALLTAALGMLWTAWISANDTVQALERKSAATDAAIHGMARIVQELRSASRASLAALPGGEIRFQIPEDLDGNGLPVDSRGVPEYGPPRRIGRDHTDMNGDGFTSTQLVLESGDNVTVLLSGLSPDADAGSESADFWLDLRDEGVHVTLRIQRKTRRHGSMPATASQLVVPRNP